MLKKNRSTAKLLQCLDLCFSIVWAIFKLCSTVPLYFWLFTWPAKKNETQGPSTKVLDSNTIDLFYKIRTNNFFSVELIVSKNLK